MYIVEAGINQKGFLFLGEAIEYASFIQEETGEFQNIKKEKRG